MSATAQRKKKEQATLSLIALTDEDWIDTLATPGLRVVDVYSKWAGTIN
jgi:hypothetical protein